MELVHAVAPMDNEDPACSGSATRLTPQLTAAAHAHEGQHGGKQTERQGPGVFF